MYRILQKETLTPVTKLYVIEAPEVARKARAGQFIILRVHEEGERIPLTIADFDREAGTITIVVQEVGVSTRLLGTMNEGDCLASFTGPLGTPTEIEEYGTVVVVGGGLGIAPGANLNPENQIAIFEATHGTAPSIAGKNCANPCSLILSGALMLQHMGWHQAADLVEAGVQRALAAKTVTLDFQRQMPTATLLSTTAFAQAVIEHLQNLSA